MVVETFKSTSYALYDRHRYKLHLNNGRSVVVEDYDMVRQCWYQFNSLMDRVEVLDVEGCDYSEEE